MPDPPPPSPLPPARRISSPRLRDFSARDFNVETLAERHDVVDSLMSQYRITHWDPLVREIDAKDKVIEHLRRNLVQARSRAELTRVVLAEPAARAQ